MIISMDICAHVKYLYYIFYRDCRLIYGFTRNLK